MPTIPAILGAKQTEGYRNKVEYTFATEIYMSFEDFRAMKASGEAPVKSPGDGGFHARGFFEKIVPIDIC